MQPSMTTVVVGLTQCKQRKLGSTFIKDAWLCCVRLGGYQRSPREERVQVFNPENETG